MRLYPPCHLAPPGSFDTRGATCLWHQIITPVALGPRVTQGGRFPKTSGASWTHIGPLPETGSWGPDQNVMPPKQGRWNAQESYVTLCRRLKASLDFFSLFLGTEHFQLRKLCKSHCSPMKAITSYQEHLVQSRSFGVLFIFNELSKDICNVLYHQEKR